MLWTCPKCGKKLRISDEQLIANDGLIVCPQCLLQAHQPIPKARVSARGDNLSTTSKRPQSSINFDMETPPAYRPATTTPPPYKKRMKQASTSYRYTGLTGANSGTTAEKKNTGKKRTKKKKKQGDGMSPLGCVGRSIVFTLVLFAAYVFFGLLIDALQ